MSKSKIKLLIIAGIAVMVVLGILAGNRLADRRDAADTNVRLDEYIGLGTRTGLTGEVDLYIQPVSLTIEPGQPVNVDLILVNKTKKPLTMNAWLTPTPADFKSNQLPVRVRCTRDGRPVPYSGNIAVLDPHSKDDFFKLKPGEKRSAKVDISQGPQKGRWDISAPGVYLFEVWYESYLTGKYAGVSAWTGMTNHAIVSVTVVPKGNRP